VTFAAYYETCFRDDLARVLRSAPAPNHLSEDAAEVVIQPRVLSCQNETVRLWPTERRALFGVALFFTVLVDQACYTHFGGLYESFRRLTAYPKFKGDCPGGCYHHLHPSLILSSLGRPPGLTDSAPPPEYAQVFWEAVPVMHREVEEFSRDRLPALDAAAFWDRCLAELPRIGPTSSTPAV
jgi:hypothetical protein